MTAQRRIKALRSVDNETGENFIELMVANEDTAVNFLFTMQEADELADILRKLHDLEVDEETPGFQVIDVSRSENVTDKVMGDSVGVSVEEEDK